MIKFQNKIYGEPNDPNTVLASQPLEHQLVVGAGNKGIKSIELPPKALLIIDENGIIDFIDFSNNPNSVLIINKAGQVELLKKSLLNMNLGL